MSSFLETLREIGAVGECGCLDDNPSGRHCSTISSEVRSLTTIIGSGRHQFSAESRTVSGTAPSALGGRQNPYRAASALRTSPINIQRPPESLGHAGPYCARIWLRISARTWVSSGSRIARKRAASAIMTAWSYSALRSSGRIPASRRIFWRTHKTRNLSARSMGSIVAGYRESVDDQNRARRSSSTVSRNQDSSTETQAVRRLQPYRLRHCPLRHIAIITENEPGS